MKTKQPQVIAISAVSGGGKTTVVKQLQDELPNSKDLYFDDYDFDDAPEDICEWVEKGADYDEWNLKPFIKDVQLLITNCDLDYVLLDYPFAYKHEEMRRYINYTIFIDTPLDVAMARRIIRNFEDSPMELLQKEMKNYLTRGRFAYLEMLKTVKPNSDYIIDGTLPVATIVKILLDEIKRR